MNIRALLFAIIVGRPYTDFRSYSSNLNEVLSKAAFTDGYTPKIDFKVFSIAMFNFYCAQIFLNTNVHN